MPSPDDRRYLDSHEWHKPDGDLIAVGISQFAVDELTDITYLEVSVDSGPIEAGDTFGEIESVKATSDLYCGIAGEVVEVNQAVVDNPALVNDDPFGEAWIIKVKPSDAAQLESLKSAADYDADHG
ncbi:glycine cleavage system protein GcvH [Algisphaera agarilytica]|uniref:Glycine cleavage system H protein n=1 Tax=Algisphaera agarilytica TaxID=1385975 RepID=A0A7X0HBJ1_9BACT|nr:glycine cleavage system protein GcvH [Algisphaera agarilytica]MBB6431394.1 glycine cleavage system H protein [Algisphaera agarilytica]